MDKREFCKQFYPNWKARAGIRVIFHWCDFCFDDRFTLEEREIHVGDLDRIFIARYKNEAGEPREWHKPDALPVSVREATEISDDTFGFVEKAIEDFREQVRRGDPLAGPIPVYSLPDNRYFLLDGNHRMIAAAREQKGFPIRAVVVNGPIDEQFLPDLRHWSK